MVYILNRGHLRMVMCMMVMIFIKHYKNDL